MIFQVFALALGAFGFGWLASGGVFTVFFSAGLIPQFAVKTHTASQILKYESLATFGVVAGGLISLFAPAFHPQVKPLPEGLYETVWWQTGSNILLILWGFFAGIFVGCLVMVIAEMLNTIPIFSRRIKMGKGLGICLTAMALGKAAGALFYYYNGIHNG